MMGRQDRDQRLLFYEFSLDEVIPAGHLLRRINGSGLPYSRVILTPPHRQPCGVALAHCSSSFSF
jgi:hypothetical protein